MSKYEYKVKFNKEENDYVVEKFGLAAKFNLSDLVSAIIKEEKTLKEFSNNADLKIKLSDKTIEDNKFIKKAINKLTDKQERILFDYLSNKIEGYEFRRAEFKQKDMLDRLKGELKELEELCKKKK
jgi:hypothetical protein